MWIIVPLAPVAIGVLVLALGLSFELQSMLPTINTIIMILIAIIFGGIGIYTLTCEISSTRKFFGTISCILGGGISAYIMHSLIQSLIAIDLGGLGFLEFIFVLFLGGCIALLLVFGCIYICCRFSD